MMGKIGNILDTIRFLCWTIVTIIILIDKIPIPWEWGAISYGLLAMNALMDLMTHE